MFKPKRFVGKSDEEYKKELLNKKKTKNKLQKQKEEYRRKFGQVEEKEFEAMAKHKQALSN